MIALSKPFHGLFRVAARDGPAVRRHARARSPLPVDQLGFELSLLERAIQQLLSSPVLPVQRSPSIVMWIRNVDALDVVYGHLMATRRAPDYEIS